MGPTVFDTTNCLVLLDRGAAWPGAARRWVHWSDLEVPEDHDSLPRLVEEQAPSLRREFLAWIHDLGEYRIKGRTLREHLRLDGSVSLWWLTLLAEKDPNKIAGVYPAWKLAVLERLYLASGCRGLVLCSTDPLLDRVLSGWCRSLGHAYHWARGAAPVAPRRTSWHQAMPHPIQAAGKLLKRLWTRRRLVGGTQGIPAGDHQAAVVTYFPNIDLQKARQGIFRSRYWGELHELLDHGPRQINWIWLFVDGEVSLTEAIELRRRFTASSGKQAHYFFVEEFITAGVVLRAIRLYLRLWRRKLALGKIAEAFHFSGSTINFWPLLAPSWHGFLAGKDAMDICLKVETFRNLAARLPRQDWGLYAWENQPWERALIAAWQDAGHGLLVGSQHATLRFLDLRFFEDPRSYRLTVDPLPLPDRLAVNGFAAWKLMDQSGFPPQRLVTVEALRYQYLPQARETLTRSRSQPDSLLVVTGYSARETASQLQLLARVGPQNGKGGLGKILVKPHPDCPVEEILRRVAPKLQVEVVHEPLTRLWPRAMAVYTANSTSASVEAAYLGLPVLIHIMEDNLNFSPLLGQAGVMQISTLADLNQGLAAPQEAVIRPDYFCLDKGLPRWRRLLDL